MFNRNRYHYYRLYFAAARRRHPPSQYRVACRYCIAVFPKLQYIPENLFSDKFYLPKVFSKPFAISRKKISSPRANDRGVFTCPIEQLNNDIVLSTI